MLAVAPSQQCQAWRCSHAQRVVRRLLPLRQRHTGCDAPLGLKVLLSVAAASGSARSLLCRAKLRASRLDLWASLDSSKRELIVTDSLLDEARQAAKFRDPASVPPLFRLVQVAFPELLPTSSAARNAVRRKFVEVSGECRTSPSEPSPSSGALLSATIHRCRVERPQRVGLDERVHMWNSGRLDSGQLKVLFHDKFQGWAVVNKPAGMHTSPIGSEAWHSLTLQSYLPALLDPPDAGTPCRGGPRTCHRLDYRVSGPVVVATSEESLRRLSLAFKQRLVHKEYRAIVYSSLGAPGDRFSVEAAVEGKPAHTEVEVLATVPDARFGALSELSLRPLEGRYHQLRVHCSQALGAPIVNEWEEIYNLATEQWHKRCGQDLPSPQKRLRGLFLQAVKVIVPAPNSEESPVTVTVDVAKRFKMLMGQAH